MRERWKVKRLSQVSKIIMGQSPKGSSYNTSGQGTPLINGPVEFGATPFSRTRRTKFTTAPTKICMAGDLILCVRGSTTGKMNIAGFDSCIGRGVAAIRAIEHQDWINFFIYANRENIYRLGSGATFPNVSGAVLSKLEVPIPPLTEQKRIVAILDEAFAGIATAVANTEQNLANARELFDSYLNNVFAQKGVGWVEKKLDAVCVVERGSSPRPIKSFLTEASDGVNWVKIGDAKGVNKYIHSTKQKITREGAERSRRVEPGDFILTNSMSYGKPYIMATNGYIHDGWFVLRLAEDINADFFYYLLASNLVQAQFGSLAAGAVVKNISSDLVKRAMLPIPPISEQRLTVREIENLATETQRLESLYQHKLTTLAELKQSILHKAFNGELTAQPERVLQEAVA